MRESSNIPSAKDIATINALFRKCRECSDALADAYAEWERRKGENAKIVKLQEKYAKASKAFDDFEKRLGGCVKFDTESGEYFPARINHGCEVFRIKVTRTQTQVITLTADDEKTALESADAFVDETKFGPSKIAFEDVSR